MTRKTSLSQPRLPAGQALVIILLLLAVALTVGLAVVSRSVTDIRLSQQEKERARVFSVAEAGLEQVMIGGGLAGDIGDIHYQVTEMGLGGGSDFDFGGGRFDEGETQTAWLVGHNAAKKPDPAAGTFGGGGVTVCWGENPAQKTGLEASLVYKKEGDFQIAKGAYDADFTRGNNFTAADDIDGGNCGNLAFGKNINFASDFLVPAGSTLYALRLKPLYNSGGVPLAIRASGGSFPSQGDCWESKATASGSDTTARVRQCRFYPSPPAVFDYVLFSETNLVK